MIAPDAGLGAGFLDVILLKGITATTQGAPLKLATQQRHLLFALLAGPGGPSGPAMRDDQLQALLWGDRSTSRHSLHNAMSKLRRTFGDRVVRTAEPGGYQLALYPGDRVDLWCWWEIVKSCYRIYAPDPHSDAPDPHSAVIATKAALDMCDLDSLATLPDTLAMMTLREGIINQYLDIAEQLGKALLSLGDNRAVISSLSGLVRGNHERENLLAILMTALAREQRWEEALRWYGELASRREILGRQPGPQLAQLRRRIAANDSTLLVVEQVPLPPSDRAVVAAGGTLQMSMVRTTKAVAGGSTDPNDPDSFTTAADRAGHLLITAMFPEVQRMIDETTAFIQKFIRQAAERGINRFLIIGSPFPAEDHRTVNDACPEEAQTVNLHFEETLVRYDAAHHTAPNAHFVCGTIRQIEQVMGAGPIRELFGLDQPMGEREPVAIVDRLEVNLIPDAHDISRIYGRMFDELRTGSMLGLVVSTDEGMTPVARKQLATMYTADPDMPTVVHRTQEEFVSCVPETLTIQRPGAVDVYMALANGQPDPKRTDPWRHLCLTAVKGPDKTAVTPS